MKKQLLRITLALLLLAPVSSFAQNDSIPRHGLHRLMWEYGTGKSVLTATPQLGNRVFVNAQPYSMHYWVTTSFSLSKNENVYLRTGIGPELKTFGLNKILAPVNQQWQLTDFPAGIQYSILQQFFVDVPVLFGISTPAKRHARSLVLEGGALAGVEAFNRVKTLSSDGTAQVVRSQESTGQTLLFRYAAVIRVMTVKKRGNFASGFFVSGSFDFGPVFKSPLNIAARSYQLEIGFSFSANQL